VLIYAVRHGQTDWNAEGRLQGARDIPINARGRTQARLNGVALGRLLGAQVASFDFVASPLGRTRETMEIIRAELGLPVAAYRTDDRLIEVSFGDWEGHTLAEIARQAPELLAARERDKWNFLPPGKRAESYEILSWRIAAWMKSVDRPTICVCHGGVIRSLLHLVGGISAHDAAETLIPQDRVLAIEDGRLNWFS
jgi:broad specificity phosphatase PhoE